MAIKDLSKTQKCLLICNGGSCLKQKSDITTSEIRQHIFQLNLDDEFHTIKTQCMGRCENAPVAILMPENLWLQKITPADSEVFLKHILAETLTHSHHTFHKMEF